MNPEWQQFLEQQGAVFEDRHNGIEIIQFSTADTEAPTDNQFTTITNTGVISIEGPDAKKFLQGQLTCNLDDIDQQHSAIGALCTYQGRTICSFRLLLDQDTYYLMLNPSLTESVMTYLGKYIAFSKAKMTDVSDQFVHIGCWGEQLEKLLRSKIDIPPLSINAVHSSTACLVIRVADNPARFSCLCDLEMAKNLWATLASGCRRMPSQNWQLMNIRSGIPEISLSTTEQFIPQMLNLDLIGGISFKKGCYTGQEIIARSHYLGKQKRRLFRLQTNSTGIPLPGADIFVEDKLRPIGTIINAATSPNSDEHEILAVLKIGVHDKKLFLDEKNEAKLSLIPLPYAIPFE